MSLTNTTATSAARAAVIAACHCTASGGDQPTFMVVGNSPPKGDLATYSTRIGTGTPARRLVVAMSSMSRPLTTSLWLTYTRTMPAPLNEKRCRRDPGGGTVPSRRADQPRERPGGVVVPCGGGSRGVIPGAPLKWGEAKY